MFNKSRARMQGLSLIGLMVAIAVGAFLLLVLSQQFVTARKLYLQTSNINSIYLNAKTAMSFLIQTVGMAGDGLMNPEPLQEIITNQGNYAGTYAVMPGWVYVGYFRDAASAASGGTPKINQQAMGGGAAPQTCGVNVKNKGGFYFGLRNGGECWYSTKPHLIFTVYSDRPPAAYPLPCSGNINYNCGSGRVDPSLGDGAAYPTYQMPIYKQLISQLSVTKNPTTGNDDLTVQFRNFHPNNTFQNFTTFAGNTIPPGTTWAYTFRVVKGKLQVQDGPNGQTYDIIDNVDFMRVLIGESDRETNFTAPSAKPYKIAAISRFIEPGNTANPDADRFMSVRIGLVLRSDAPLPESLPASPIQVMRGNDGQWITYTPPPKDQYLRKAFVFTIPLPALRVVSYLPHCVPGAGGYVIKIGGIRFQPFQRNDLCCATQAGGACISFRTLAECERGRAIPSCISNQP